MPFIGASAEWRWQVSDRLLCNSCTLRVLHRCRGPSGVAEM